MKNILKKTVYGVLGLAVVGVISGSTVVSTPPSGLFSGPGLSVDPNCGTSPGLGGNQIVGRITLGSSPGGYCFVHFPTAFPNSPVCIVANESDGSRTVFPQPQASGLAIVATSGSLNGGDSLTFICNGYF